VFGLKTKKKNLAGPKRVLFLGDLGRPPIREFFRGFQKYSRLYDCQWVVYVNAPHYQPPDLKRITPNNIRRWGVQGFVDILDDPDKSTKLLSLNLPCIHYSSSQKHPFSKYTFSPDYARIADMAAKHFLGKNFVNFAYCGFESVETSQERGQAFVKSLAETGFRAHVYEHNFSKESYSWKKELPWLMEWLQSLPKPVGLLAGSDDRGREVLQACQVGGLNVPEEVAVLGMGDEDIICELATPPLSSICMNTRNVGYQVAELLNRLMTGESLPPLQILDYPTRVIERQSTNILAIDDDVVKQAVRFIRQNSMEAIAAADVAKAVFLGVRTLDRRFKKSLGRSVHSEITQVRIEQACNLLTQTNLSISQIAIDLGYSDPPALTLAFKREKGIGPLAYRKKYVQM
jgi:LacI family transcriptional regulator